MSVFFALSYLIPGDQEEEKKRFTRLWFHPCFLLLLLPGHACACGGFGMHNVFLLLIRSLSCPFFIGRAPADLRRHVVMVVGWVGLGWAGFEDQHVEEDWRTGHVSIVDNREAYLEQAQRTSNLLSRRRRLLAQSLQREDGGGGGGGGGQGMEGTNEKKIKTRRDKKEARDRCDDPPQVGGPIATLVD